MQKEISRPIKLVLLLVSLVLTLVLGGSAVWLQTLYFQHYPYFFDPVVYAWDNINLSKELAHSSRIGVAWQEWLTNSKNPLRTVPIILLAPGLLTAETGHVATVLPALLAFLILLGWTVYRRTHSLIYAVGSVALFCATPGLLSPIYGLGAYWLDLPAALWVGAAALSLLNFIEARYLRWLLLASTLAAFACLSRYIAIAYIILICAPVLLVHLVQVGLQEKSIRRAILMPLAAALLPLLALSGHFLVTQFSSNYTYYTEFGYALKNDSFEAFIFVIQSLIEYFFSIPLIAILALIFILNLFLARQELFSHRKDLFITSWYATSVILFLTYLGTKDAVQSTMYAVPLLFFAAVSPVPQPSQIRLLQKFRKFFAYGLMATAFLILPITLNQNFDLVTHPKPPAKEQKRVDASIAEVLAREAQDQTLLWESFFDERSFTPSLEQFYRFGKPVEPKYLFTIHEAYWKAFYPGLSPDEISSKVYAIAVQSLDVVVVLENPKRASRIPGLKDDLYSQTVAAHMSVHLPQDSRWKRLSAIRTRPYGRLVFYRNLSRLKES